MSRVWLRDDQFEWIAELLPGKVSDSGRTAANNRLFVESVLWTARTGSPWRSGAIQCSTSCLVIRRPCLFAGCVS